MSRRKDRYFRRNKNRVDKRHELLNKYDNFYEILNYNALFNSAKVASKGVGWKASVQRYMINILINIYNTKKDLIAGKDIRKGFIEFNIFERGKQRNIKSVHFSERVIQKSLCMHSLYKILTHNLIYDNGASQKKKGVHFSVKRLIKHLQKYYKKHKNNGYVLVIDFKNYFENIQHKQLKNIYNKYYTDKKLLNLANLFIDAFGNNGLGLGSETCQLDAIAYPNKIDHFIKDFKGIKFYGRYMDDSYIIHDNKQFLHNLLDELDILFKELGIVLNIKKSQIIKLSKGFCFLKTNFYLTKTGKIIKKPSRKAITQERRKLKKQAKLVNNKYMTLEQMTTSYNSWRGSMLYRDAKRTLYYMDILFNKLTGVLNYE